MFGRRPVGSLDYTTDYDISDLAVLTESLARNISSNFLISETIVFGEVQNKVTQLLDSAALTERILQVQVLLESLGISESLTTTKAVSLLDHIVLTELIARNGIAGRSFTDFPILIETPTPVLNKGPSVHWSECLVLYESLHKVYTRNITDTLVLLDEIIKGVSDIVIITDLLEHNGLINKCGEYYLPDKAFSEVLTLAEALSIGGSKSGILTDSLALYDAIIRIY